MFAALKEMLQSKKAIAFYAGLLMVLLSPLLNKLGLTITPEKLELVVQLVIGYIVGQGAADFGKSVGALKAPAKK